MCPIPENLRINFPRVLSEQLDDLECATLLCLYAFAHSELSKDSERVTQGRGLTIIDHDKRKTLFALHCRRRTSMMRFALSLMRWATQTDTLESEYSESPSVQSRKRTTQFWWIS